MIRRNQSIHTHAIPSLTRSGANRPVIPGSHLPSYSDNLSEEVTKGMLGKAQGGDFPVRAPVGYLNDKNRRKIVVEPEYHKPFQLLAYAATEFANENADPGPDDPRSAFKWAWLDEFRISQFS